MDADGEFVNWKFLLHGVNAAALSLGLFLSDHKEIFADDADLSELHKKIERLRQEVFAAESKLIASEMYDSEFFPAVKKQNAHCWN
jgi:hypothetical protein